MRENHSPWLHQLDTKRVIQKIENDTQTDVCIIGGGISGVATAFFLLKYTDKKVILCERNKIGRGATGHNAGQIVSYFERPFHDLVEQFGLEKTAQAQKDIENAWQLLDEMYTDASLDIPLSRFEGHMGIRTKEQLESYLKDTKLRLQAGLRKEKICVAIELSDVYKDVLDYYVGMFEYIPHSDILQILETENKDFIASVSFQKGVTNSALFVQEVTRFLQGAYKDRFSLFEHTAIQKIVFQDNTILLDAITHTIETAFVVLCTNGFEGFSLYTKDGLELNKKFHARVYSQVAYMSGYTESLSHPPTAISYLNTDVPKAEADYFYLTRRPFELEKDVKHSLVCIGGPTSPLYDELSYRDSDEYPEKAIEDINTFLETTYKHKEDKQPEYKFTWHGLMGYTKNYVRMIGKDPSYTNLLYNLGCNGIGILPSLYGAKKVSEVLQGVTHDPSIFDVIE